MHLVFVELKKAYDSAPINKLQVAIEEDNILIKYILKCHQKNIQKRYL